MFWFDDCLSLILKRPKSSKMYFLFSRHRTLKSSKGREYSQFCKWCEAAVSFLSCTFLLVKGGLRKGGAKKPPLPKISHIYHIFMKLSTGILYLQKIQKIYESRDTFLEFCWHQHFYQKSANFAISRNIDIDSILMHSF